MTLNNESEAKLKKIINKMPKPNPNQPFRFIFLGDSRGANPPQISPYFDIVLKKAVQRNPLFIVHGGDTVYYGNQTNLELFDKQVRKIDQNLKVPFFVLVGNHDIPDKNNNFDIFKKVIGKIHFKIDIPQYNFKLIPINNTISRQQYNGGFPGGKNNFDLKFLANELKTNRNVVLAMHSPPAVGPWKAVKHGFTIGFNDYFNTIRPAQNQGKIKMVLASHIHAYSTQKIGGFGKPNPKGVRYIVSGGAGAPGTDITNELNKPQNQKYKKDFIFQLHFVEFKVYPNGKIERTVFFYNKKTKKWTPNNKI